MISISSVVMDAWRFLQQRPNNTAHIRPQGPRQSMQAQASHLLYISVSLPRISPALLDEFSMADMRDACSLQLFSNIAL